MKRVYVAGPYNADNICQSLDNIGKGIRASIEVLKAGYAPFCPWLDFQYGIIAGGEITREMYQDFSLAWIRVADAVLVLPGWECSEGTKREVELARELSIPVYYHLGQLKREVV